MTIVSSGVQNDYLDPNFVGAGDTITRLDVRFKTSSNRSAYRVRIYARRPNEYVSGAVIYEKTVTKNLTAGTEYQFHDANIYVKDVSSELISYGYGENDVAELVIKVYAGSTSDVAKEMSNTGAVGTYLVKRKNPTVTSVSVSGDYVFNKWERYCANYSKFKVTCGYSLDTSRGAYSISNSFQKAYMRVYCNNNFVAEYWSTTNSFDAGPFSSAGTYIFECTVYDKYSNYGTNKSSNVTLHEYTKPTVSALSGALAQRYAVKRDGSGNTYKEVDDMGDKIWLNYSASAMRTVAGESNPFSATATITSSSRGSSTITLFSNNTNGSYQETRREAGFFSGGSISYSEPYTVVVTVTDQLSSASTSIVINAATCVFNIEKYGVSVGRMSTGFGMVPKFESAYNAYFDKDVNVTGDFSARSISSNNISGEFSGKCSKYELTNNEQIYLTVGNTGGFICPVFGYDNNIKRVYLRIPIAKSFASLSYFTIDALQCAIGNDGGWGLTKDRSGYSDYLPYVDATYISWATNEFVIGITGNFNLSYRTAAVCEPGNITLTAHTN